MNVNYTSEMLQALINYAFVPEKVYPMMKDALLNDINIKAASCINNHAEYKWCESGFVLSLAIRGADHKRSLAEVEQYIATCLADGLSPQVIRIMEQDKQARIKDQRWLDRLAYGECACTGNYIPYDIDLNDDYDAAQRFFEKQHKVRF